MYLVVWLLSIPKFGMLDIGGRMPRSGWCWRRMESIHKFHVFILIVPAENQIILGAIHAAEQAITHGLRIIVQMALERIRIPTYWE